VLCPFLRGRAGQPHLTECGMGQGLPPYQKWDLDPSSRLGTTDMARKFGGCAQLDPHLTLCGLGRGLPLCPVASYPSNRLATIQKRYRQDRQTTVRYHRTNRFTNGRAKISVYFMSCSGDKQMKTVLHYSFTSNVVKCWLTVEIRVASRRPNH